MTAHDYNDGLPHLWHGGECPVHPKSVVAYWMRDPDGLASKHPASVLDWRHNGNDWDILAFRVIKPYREPREGWAVHIYDSARQAKIVHPGATPFRVREIMEGEE